MILNPDARGNKCEGNAVYRKAAKTYNGPFISV
jgi:hypothetical protein